MKLTWSEFLLSLAKSNDKKGEKPNFYGIVAGTLRVRAVDPNDSHVWAMAVSIESGRYVLLYNPVFLAKYSYNVCVFVLEHEIGHIVLDHIPRYLEFLANNLSPLERDKTHVIGNIALDCADNSLLRGSPRFASAVAELVADGKGIILPEKYELEERRAAEYYLEELRKTVQTVSIPDLLKMLEQLPGGSHDNWAKSASKDQPKAGEGPEMAAGLPIPGVGDAPEKGAGAGGEATDSGQGDGEGAGSGGGNGHYLADFNGAPPDELRALAERLRTHTKQALRRVVGGTGRGTVPGELEQWLAEYLSDPVIPWWELVTSRARATRQAKQDRTLARLNRKMIVLASGDERIVPLPGRIDDATYNIFVFADTSGSMSDESLQILFNELEFLMREGEDTTVRFMQGDAAVTADKVYRGTEKIERVVHGRGGTEFNAYFQHMQQYCNNDEKKPDIVFVYTDGYAPAVDRQFYLPNEIPVIWLITPNGSTEHLKGYGEVIRVDPTQNADHEDR